MFCEKCGKEVDADVTFCPACGSRISCSENGLQKKQEQKTKRNNRHSGKKWIVFAMLAVLLVVAGAIGAFVVRSNAKEKEYTDKLEEARQLVAEEAYDDAIRIYKDAIRIVADKDTAYLELAEVYERQGNIEKAVEVLEDAKKNAESDEVTETLEDLKEKEKKEEQKKKQEQQMKEQQEHYQSLYDEFVQGVLIPKYGECTGKEMSLYYQLTGDPYMPDTGIASVSKPEEVLGVITQYRTDLNMDGIPELLVVRAAQEEADSEMYTGFIYVQVYTIENGVVKELKQPFRTMRYSSLQLLESGNLHIFIKEESGEKYICVLNCMRSDVFQTHYYTYMDICQMEGDELVCRKSVTVASQYLYDSTEIKVADTYSDGMDDKMKRDILFEVSNPNIPYSDVATAFKDECEEYFTLEDEFAEELEHDAARKFGYEEKNESLLPYDENVSERLEHTTELLRLQARWVHNASVQEWKYFSDVQ